MARNTAQDIVDTARRLIVARGYNGFSYADVAAAVGIRKASIHHHFAGKSDLAKAVVEESRAIVHGFAERLAEHGDAADGRAELRGYVEYWQRCVVDDQEPFCVAAMLAAELPSLPEDLASAVRAHFAEVTGWLAAALALGARQGSIVLARSPADEADAVMAAVYGAMLSARAFGEPGRFAAITDALLTRLEPAAGSNGA